MKMNGQLHPVTTLHKEKLMKVNSQFPFVRDMNNI